MSVHELVITEDGDLEFRCNAKPKDGARNPDCWFTAQGIDMGHCDAAEWIDTEGIDLYDKIVIPVDVSWMGPDNSPVLTSCWEDELEEPHSRDNRISREPPYDSSLYCSCNQGPFSTDYDWALHQAGARLTRMTVLKEQLMRFKNELEQLQEQIDKAHAETASVQAGMGVAELSHPLEPAIGEKHIPYKRSRWIYSYSSSYPPGLYCSCAAGPFPAALDWATHRISVGEIQEERLRQQVVRLKNELEKFHECDDSNGCYDDSGRVDCEDGWLYVDASECGEVIRKVYHRAGE